MSRVAQAFGALPHSAGIHMRLSYAAPDPLRAFSTFILSTNWTIVLAKSMIGPQQ